MTTIANTPHNTSRSNGKDIHETFGSIGVAPSSLPPLPLMTKEERLNLLYQDVMTKVEAVFLDGLEVCRDFYVEAQPDLQKLRQLTPKQVRDAVPVLRDLTTLATKWGAAPAEHQAEMRLISSRLECFAVEMEYIADQYVPQVPDAPGVPPLDKEDWASTMAPPGVDLTNQFKTQLDEPSDPEGPPFGAKKAPTQVGDQAAGQQPGKPGAVGPDGKPIAQQKGQEAPPAGDGEKPEQGGEGLDLNDVEPEAPEGIDRGEEDPASAGAGEGEEEAPEEGGDEEGEASELPGGSADGADSSEEGESGEEAEAQPPEGSPSPGKGADSSPRAFTDTDAEGGDAEGGDQGGGADGPPDADGAPVAAPGKRKPAEVGAGDASGGDDAGAGAVAPGGEQGMKKKAPPFGKKGEEGQDEKSSGEEGDEEQDATGGGDGDRVSGWVRSGGAVDGLPDESAEEGGAEGEPDASGGDEADSWYDQEVKGRADKHAAELKALKEPLGQGKMPLIPKPGSGQLINVKDLSAAIKSLVMKSGGDMKAVAQMLDGEPAVAQVDGKDQQKSPPQKDAQGASKPEGEKKPGGEGPSKSPASGKSPDNFAKGIGKLKAKREPGKSFKGQISKVKESKDALDATDRHILKQMSLAILDPGYGGMGGDLRSGAELDSVRKLKRLGYAEWVIGKGYRITDAGKAIVATLPRVSGVKEAKSFSGDSDEEVLHIPGLRSWSPRVTIYWPTAKYVGKRPGWADKATFEVLLQGGSIDPDDPIGTPSSLKVTEEGWTKILRAIEKKWGVTGAKWHGPNWDNYYGSALRGGTASLTDEQKKNIGEAQAVLQRVQALETGISPTEIGLEPITPEGGAPREVPTEPREYIEAGASLPEAAHVWIGEAVSALLERHTDARSSSFDVVEDGHGGLMTRVYATFNEGKGLNTAQVVADVKSLGFPIYTKESGGIRVSRVTMRGAPPSIAVEYIPAGKKNDLAEFDAAKVQLRSCITGLQHLGYKVVGGFPDRGTAIIALEAKQSPHYGVAFLRLEGSLPFLSIAPKEGRRGGYGVMLHDLSKPRLRERMIADAIYENLHISRDAHPARVKGPRRVGEAISNAMSSTQTEEAAISAASSLRYDIAMMEDVSCLPQDVAMIYEGAFRYSYEAKRPDGSVWRSAPIEVQRKDVLEQTDADLATSLFMTGRVLSESDGSKSHVPGTAQLDRATRVYFHETALGGVPLRKPKPFAEAGPKLSEGAWKAAAKLREIATGPRDLPTIRVGDVLRVGPNRVYEVLALPVRAGEPVLTHDVRSGRDLENMRLEALEPAKLRRWFTEGSAQLVEDDTDSGRKFSIRKPGPNAYDVHEFFGDDKPPAERFKKVAGYTTRASAKAFIARNGGTEV